MVKKSAPGKGTTFRISLNQGALRGALVRE
jgi:hypothetical protein